MNSVLLTSDHRLTDPWSPFAEHYQDIITRAASVIATYPPVLQQAARSYWDRLLQAPFTRIAVLLPAWTGEMLGSSQEVNVGLGLANLWGWAYYRLQDWLVDDETEHDHAILFGIAFFAEYLRILCESLPHDPSFSDLILEMTLTASEANAREATSRFRHLGEINEAMLDLGPLERLAERAAPLNLAVIAQLRLTSHSASDALYQDTLECIRAYSIFNQLLDDEEDWVADLRAGRLNSYSATLLQRLQEKKEVYPSIEWLVGYSLNDQEFLAERHRLKMGYLERVSVLASRHNGHALASFCAEMRARLVADYYRLSEARRAFVSCFHH
jgi:hypothetical protein